MHVLLGPMPAGAPSGFSKLESGAATDWPYGVSEDRWLVFWIWLAWSEFLAPQSGDLDLSQKSKFRKRVGPWGSPFPDLDLSVLTQEKGIMSAPVGFARCSQMLSWQ